MKDIDSVISDEIQEMHSTGDVSSEAMPDDEALQPPETAGGNIQTLRVKNSISNDDRRLLSLEKKVDQLEKTLRTDRKRFQRMLMLLALSDDNDKDLLDKLKDLDVADK